MEFSSTALREASKSIASEFSEGRKHKLIPISEGYSAAQVFVFELLGSEGEAINPPKIGSGRYILKVSKAQDKQGSFADKLLEMADRLNAGSAYAIIPNLIESLTYEFEGLSYSAILSEVAGGSLNAITSPILPQDGRVFKVLPELFSKMFEKWADGEVGSQMASPSSILGAWNRRLEDPKIARSVNKTFEGILGAKTVGRHRDHVLLNPLKLGEVIDSFQIPEIAFVSGFLHRDLHSQNLLFEYVKQTPRFWVIDFAMARTGPIGFDQAYLQLSQILINLNGFQPGNILYALDAHFQDAMPPFEMPEFNWLSRFLEMCRDAEDDWISTNHPNWSEDVHKQLKLAKVAVGLNWVNKPIGEQSKLIAALYASYHATLFLKQYHFDIWNQLLENNADQDELDVSEQSGISTSDWAQIWELAGGFKSSEFRYVLVAEPQRNIQNLEALGRLPWDFVIDLDGESSEVGLFAKCRTEVESKRAVHSTISGASAELSFQGVTWYFANGWHSRSIPTPEIRSWLYETLDTLREIVRVYVRKKSEKPTIVVILPGYTSDAKEPHFRLQKCIDVLDESLRGDARFLIAGDFKSSNSVTAENKYPLGCSVSDLALSISRIVAATEGISDAMVPSSEGEWKKIDQKRLIVLQENLDVLHTQIATEFRNIEESEFWRGRSPSWAEIALNVDIERRASQDICAKIDDVMEAGVSRTILVSAVPGSGATTILRRAAWSYREKYATAIIHRASKWLADKLVTLHNISEAPILIFAESSELSETAREDLFKDLINNGVRFVLVYFRRTFRSLDQDDDAEGDGVFAQKGLKRLAGSVRNIQREITIADPMHRTEAENFLRRFSQNTDDKRRIEELHRITYDDGLSRYRSPFFYGLVTYQHEFLKVDEYVGHHLHIRKLNEKTKKLFEYLALLTRFSSKGLTRGFINGILGLNADSELNLVVSIGEGPAGLIVEETGFYRLSHQILAEAVLQHLNNSKWDSDLTDVARDFIEDAGRILPKTSEYILDLLKELFVDRVNRTGFESEDRRDFSPLIETVSGREPSAGSQIFAALTEHFPIEAHFWTHRGRFQLYRRKLDDLSGAESFIENAVRLSPKDALHHHVLGMVRRQRLRQIVTNSTARTAIELLEETGVAFEESARCFAESRRFSPKDAHGYITHAQLILFLALALKQKEGDGSITKFSPTVGGWLQSELTKLHDLLDEVSTLYSEIDEPDKYIAQCRADLQKLMGDVDEVVRTWEVFNAGSQTNPYSRRALAQAYLDRAGGEWSKLSIEEIEAIITHTEKNLFGRVSIDRDYELWFEAKLRHPQFETDEVSLILSSWKEKSSSWRAHYYSACIGFTRWFFGMTDDNSFERDLLRANELYNGKRGVSFLWIGKSPNGFPLVSSSDLGDWDRKAEGFWSKKSQQRLIKVSGFVSERPLRPQSGEINLSRDVRAFFVPGKEMASGEHENSAISFFLGISLEGLRAWKAKADDSSGMRRVPVSTEIPTHKLVDTQYASRSLGEISEIKTTVLVKRVKAFVREYVSASLDRGEVLQLSELQKAVLSSFARQTTGTEDFGFSLLDFVRSISGVMSLRDESQDDFVISRKPETTVRQRTLFGKVLWARDDIDGVLLDEHGTKRYFRHSSIHRHSRSVITENSIVTFVPDKDIDSGTGLERHLAKELQVTDAQIPNTVNADEYSADELHYMVEREILRLLDASIKDKKQLSLGELEDQVKLKFRVNGEIGEKLAALNFADYLKRLQSVWVDFRADSVVVAKAGVVPVGIARTTSENLDKSAEVQEEYQEAWNDVYEAVFDFIQSEVVKAQQAGNQAQLSHIAKKVGMKFKQELSSYGADSVHAFLGFESFRAMMKSHKQFKIVKKGLRQFLITDQKTVQVERAKSESKTGGREAISKRGFERWLLKELSNQPQGEEGILLSQLPQLASKKFLFEGKIADALNAKNLAHFLRNLNSVEVDNPGPGLSRVYKRNR